MSGALTQLGLILCAGVGGTLGALARYHAGGWVQRTALVSYVANLHAQPHGESASPPGDTRAIPAPAQPSRAHDPLAPIIAQGLGIIVVNLTGCILAGLVSVLVNNAWMNALMATGVLGGYTTFSTAMTDLWAIMMVKEGGHLSWRAITVGGLVGLATLVTCVAGAWLGMQLGHLMR